MLTGRLKKNCASRGKYGKNTSYTGRKWGHIYFIPLIPDGPRVRVLKQCKKCSNGVQIPEKDIPNILNDLRQVTKDALVAIIAGESTFDDNGTITPATGCLAGAVEMLLCLQADDHLRLVLSALQEKQKTHAYHLVKGESLEFQGKLDEAEMACHQSLTLLQSLGEASADDMGAKPRKTIETSKRPRQVRRTPPKHRSPLRLIK